MLKTEHRLRRAEDFKVTMRRGKAASTASVVVHAVMTKERRPAKVGFVVGRAVGGAVVRNTVRRRLRHLMADRVDELPPGTNVVIRARPAAAGMSSAVLASYLDRTLPDALRRARGR
ncbi:ribonuclease P protein component [Actinobacteria bacterium YIM 96077]|uniref:Ribonuclease P protein component n=1 Tax=Phytoactinopolyspora halophila TaxID=1981511 RepID=A0A329QSQ5_9ACTN|nr:ribonuclease P protein component [Phytoactinopolyspora halophila]AYY15110.1 ribonuclease P protein component [Actinobacteria bacterium YIM 96077]RAW14709.1 ribonuclease P protein component [Phytoactinopolyspora halophila]